VTAHLDGTIRDGRHYVRVVSAAASCRSASASPRPPEIVLVTLGGTGRAVV
jgi:hypothetical protein